MANGVRREIDNIVSSGDFYVTNEIANELSNIRNAIDHLNLDGSILSTTDSFRPGKTGQESNVAARLLNSTAEYLQDFKSQMHQNALRNKQENEIRELHQWGVNNLRGLQNSMDDVTYNAADRIRRFGDHVGVTDRYTGYRNNLTRGSREPFRMQTKWMDRSAPQGFMNSLNAGRPWTAFENRSGSQYYYGEPSEALKSRVRFGSALPRKRDTRGYQTIDSLYPRSNSMYVDRLATKTQGLELLKSMNNTNALPRDDLHIQSNMAAVQPRGLKNMSVQEQAGINMNFPGRTEYMHKYTEPPMDIPTSDFNINPEPNFKLHGRPLDTTKLYPSITEYQSRYEFPDSDKIVRLPWLRK
ncbi:hypothetical protein FSP39_018209 [Pinctada imbricata]|uniref:Uncharacterized protein n=1 Tax=Pinctada imbricata TaxID=66713 RepID=A0AA88Y5X8_PINIB|nr:hypothetical protein FSP39_018209 [Pinctada imbricata]